MCILKVLIQLYKPSVDCTFIYISLWFAIYYISVYVCLYVYMCLYVFFYMYVFIFCEKYAFVDQDCFNL